MKGVKKRAFGIICLGIGTFQAKLAMRATAHPPL